MADQILVLQRFASQQRGQRIAEQVRILPVVEPEGHFVKVSVQMFRGELMVRTDDGALEQAPDVLNGVRNERHHGPILPERG